MVSVAVRDPALTLPTSVLTPALRKASLMTAVLEPQVLTTAHWSSPAPGAPTLSIPVGRGRTHEAHDFSRIVPDAIPCPDAECEDCVNYREGNQWWTPRNADLLHLAGVLCVESKQDYLGMFPTGGSQWREPVRHTFDGVVPNLVLDAMAASPLWVDRFLGCFRDLLARVAAGDEAEPRCTGEEMALQILVQEAAARSAEYEIGEDADEYCLAHLWKEVEAALPSCEYDYDFEGLHDMLVEDFDIEFLFHESTSDLALAGSILHPDNWFVGFYDYSVAPLGAGFER